MDGAAGMASIKVFFFQLLALLVLCIHNSEFQTSESRDMNGYHDAKIEVPFEKDAHG
jgi:hypothetical protein